MSQIATISKSILTERNSTYSANDVIELFISPGEVPLLNARQGTYLKFDLKVDNTSNCLAQPDPLAGAYSCIQRIDIYDGNNSQLLEQLSDVNAWTSMRWHYDANSGIKNSRNLMEGRSPIVGRSLKSQYFTHTGIDATTYTPVSCVCPIYMSGLLSPNSQLLPLLLLNGIRIRIQLAHNAVALRGLTQVGYSSSATEYVGIKQINGIDTPGASVAHTFGMRGSSAGDAVGAAAVPIPIGSVLTRLNVSTIGALIDPTPPVDTSVIQASADFSNIAWAIGQDLWIGGGVVIGQAQNLGPITGVVVTAGRPGFTFAATPATLVAIPLDCKMWVNANSLQASYTMSNVGMVCSVVQAPPATLAGLLKKVNSGGGVRIDYTSFNLYRQNLNAKIPRTELLIPTVENRAMSIAVLPMRTTSLLFEDTLRSVGDEALSYQWNLGNRLTPNRRVLTDRVASVDAVQTLKWNGIHLHETEKAMARLKVPPRNLVSNSRMFSFPRALSKEGHSYNANLNEVRLNIEYGQGANDNVLNKLTNGWVHHIRTAIITPNSVAVEF